MLFVFIATKNAALDRTADRDEYAACGGRGYEDGEHVDWGPHDGRDDGRRVLAELGM